MAVPIQLEIFMKDLTQAGLLSVAKNVEGAEQETLSLIKALQKVRAEYVRILNANKEAGKSYQQEAAMVQALTGQIKGLEEGLKELQKAKQHSNDTPVVSPNTTVDMDAVYRKTNNLRMQFSQVARELPSLAMGPQMFILAISNNLPMLTDAIADVRKQNELLKASGQKSVPVWKQLASSLFSWQTALVAAISLGIVFGKDIADWTKKLFKGKEASLSYADVQKKVADSLKENSGNLGEQIVKVRSLSERWKELGDDMDAKKKFIKENREELNSLGTSVNNVSDAENLLVTNTESYITAMSLRAQAAAALKLASDEATKSVQKQMEIEQEKQNGPSFWDKVRATLAASAPGTVMPTSAQTNVTAEEVQQGRIDGLEEEKQAADETEAAYRKLFTTLTQQAKEALKAAGIDLSGNDDDENKHPRKDYATELAEARLRAEQTVERLRIQLMQEGIEKRKAMARQEYDEQKADIDRQEQETLAKMDAARKQGATITASQYEQVRQNANQQRILQQQVLNRKLTDIDREYQEQAIEAQIAYNKQYGTYAEQRAAIIAEGLRKAAKAETDGARDLIMRQTEDALKELDFAHFKDSINFADVFGQLDTQTTDALTILRDKLKEYINNAADELGPEDLKELQDAFKELDLKIAERDPFGELRSGMDEYRTAQEDVKKAQADLNTVMQGGEVITGLYTDENGRLCKNLLTLEQAESNLNSAQQKRQQTLEKLTRSANSIGAQGMQVVNAGRDIVEMLGNFGVEVPEAVTATLDGLGQVMSGLESIDLTKPFSMITGSVSILTGIGNTIAGLFGGGRDFSDYEELKSRYEALSDIWDTLISKKQEYIDIDYGVEAQKAADEARQLVEVSIQRQRQLAQTLAGSGAGWFSHSEGYKVNDRLGTADWKRLSELVGQQVGSLNDVLNLDADIIGKVLQDETFVSVLTSVNSEFITYIENIEKYGEQLEEIARQEQEAITGIGFDAFKDGYIDMLADLDSTNEDFAKNFEQYLQNAILRSLIANKYAADIKALYDDWAEMGADGLSKEEVEALRQQQQELTDRLLKEREQLKDLFGWTSDEAATGSSQSPQSGALTTMSQDSISTFEGIGRSVQTHLISIDKVVQEIRQAGKEDSEALMQIVANTSHLLPIRELLEKFDREGIKMQ